MGTRAVALRVWQGNQGRYSRYYPYALGIIILAACVFSSRPFWQTNDDVSMAMVSSGTGIAAWPSPRLVMTNIVWGYLVGWLPSIGGIQPYTAMTYLALILSYFVMLYALVRSQAKPLLGAAVLLIVFVPILIYPQFTVVAGYLAGAGILLLCIPPEKQSIPSICLAGILVVLSGLVRADETALVAVVMAPIGLGYWYAAAGSLVRRRWLIVLAVSGAVFLGLQLLDYYTFSPGQWALFGDTYALRTEFTDFNLAGYYEMHPQILKGSGYTGNDMQLFRDWFYADPRVFSADKLSPIVHRAPLVLRLIANLHEFPAALAPFLNPQVLALCVVIILGLLCFGREKYFELGVLALLGCMVLLLLLGRPGITRIYVPALAALALAAIMRPMQGTWRTYIFLTLTVALSTTLLLAKVYQSNQSDIRKSTELQAVTNHMPHEPFLVIWGDRIHYTQEYLPFGSAADALPFKTYTLGPYSLAPYSLDGLYAYTGGKDLVQALVAGQALDFVASVSEMRQLQAYIKWHYATDVTFTQTQSNKFFTVFKMQKQQALAKSSASCVHCVTTSS